MHDKSILVANSLSSFSLCMGIAREEKDASLGTYTYTYICICRRRDAMGWDKIGCMLKSSSGSSFFVRLAYPQICNIPFFPPPCYIE